jgi:hypothetical protein
MPRKNGRMSRGGSLPTPTGGLLPEGGKVNPGNITSLEWWMPENWHEFLIFLLAVFLTYWVIQIFQYNLVENKIIKNSRCYKNNHALQSGTQYVVASNAQNKPLYRVSYNMASKQTSIDCACHSGPALHALTIPVYDLVNNSISVVKKQCSCDQPLLSASPNIYFSGYPGIVKFMNTASISKNVLSDPTIDTSYFLPTN